MKNCLNVVSLLANSQLITYNGITYILSYKFDTFQTII